ncbi:DUF6415 family natural product biosynthesis protein (plasmid) [Streptomyces sp. CWNU-52B]|uniref:DUF6415 family natural product biosynthesis protein n=1 Tax=unclassified Streptomyces TaxID=2593676 RepID=UPI0039C1768C
MDHRTGEPSVTAERATHRNMRLSLDIAVMRDAARQLLGENAELPSDEEVDTVTLQLRGHLMLLIPEVETAALRLPECDIPRACALACIGEARMRLRADPASALPRQVAHVQRLARSVNALVDHFENLGAIRGG